MEPEEASLKCICIKSLVQSVLAHLLRKMIIKHPDCVSTNTCKALSQILQKRIYCLRKISKICNTDQFYDKNINNNGQPTLKTEIPIDELSVDLILSIMKVVPGFLMNPANMCPNHTHRGEYETFRSEFRKRKISQFLHHPAWKIAHNESFSQNLLICCTKCRMCGKCNSMLTISKQCKLYRLVSSLRLLQSLLGVASKLSKADLQNFLDARIHLNGFPEVSNWEDMVLLITMNVRNILTFIGDRVYKEKKERELINIMNVDSGYLEAIYAKEISRHKVVEHHQRKFIETQSALSKDKQTRKQHGSTGWWGNENNGEMIITALSTSPKLPDYYHGRIERETAESLLRKQCNGTYLLRRTYSDGSYYLSYKFRGEKIMHVRVENNGCNKYVFPNNMVQQVFPSLDSAVDVFMGATQTKFPFLSTEPLMQDFKKPIFKSKDQIISKCVMKSPTKISGNNRFENCFWYFPKLPRSDAITLLSPSYSGTYLLRDSSSPGSFALTYKSFDQSIRNLLIKQQTNGHFQFATKSKKKVHSFSSPQIAAIVYMDSLKKPDFTPIPYGWKTYV